MKFTRSGNSSQVPANPHPISVRLSEIRITHFGQRGRSRFARELGVPVTSYIHYETDRPPPAELLVRAAQVTGTRLEWLLCGIGPRERNAEEDSQNPVRQICNELQKILEASPDLLPSAAELVQLLRSQQHSLTLMETWTSEGLPSSLIPIVGSTAAGVARYWHELAENDPTGENRLVKDDSHLEELLAAHGHRDLAGQGQAVSAASRESEPVALVQYSRPDELGILEFLDAAAMKLRYPDAVAWRIDGESMFPRYQDGDFVITSPCHPAVEMQPCVARQYGQIGVNCKLFQMRGDTVLLIPINEASRIQELPRSQLLWAWRVLASVRLNPAGRHG